ncbi:MAG: von Willebrand factor type A domain-containing protein [Pseudomonadota bacterium]
MTEDELDRMARAFASDPPPQPAEGAKRAAMAAAMVAFEKSAATAQAEANLRRLSHDRTVGFGNWMRTKAMQVIDRLTSRPALLGGTSLAVMALAVVATQNLSDTGPVDLSDLGAVVTETSSDAASEAETRTAGPAVEYEREAAPADAQRADPAARAPSLSLAEERAVRAEPAPGPIPSVDTRTRSFSRPGPQAHVGEAAPEHARRLDPVAPAPELSLAQEPAVQAGPAQGRMPNVGAGTRGFFRPSPQAVAPSLGQAEALPAPIIDMPEPGYREHGRDRFEAFEENAVKRVAEEPVSTFSIDVDTASYSLIRRHLREGLLPPRDAVRVEEMINYFAYDYPMPDGLETPFRADVAITPTPWNADTELLRIGLQGYALPAEQRPRANLVFLIDSSGSMNSPDKLPLLINAFRMLVETLGPEDQVSIVAYAGSAGTVLEPTPASEKSRILAALERLSAGGSTAGGEGIRQAYALAEANLDPDGVNRVFLATDGDFNVGIRSTDELESFVERKRDGGVLLSVLGFGRGNLNDQLMQALAQAGNGQALYIDTLSEAQKALVKEAGGSLFPIAKDVKIQIEFNPAVVSEYRLIGYETRALAREDFNNDRVDAGEIGSGHRVTALYEITPVGSAAERIEPLRYQSETPAASPTMRATAADEIAFLKIRHKKPEGGPSALTTRPIIPADRRADAEADWAAAVAAFGQILRGGRHTRDFDLDQVIALANRARGDDFYGYRGEFLRLVRLAKTAATLEPQRR